METYVFLLQWTESGLQRAANSVERATKTIEAMERLGVRIFETYWTVGPYDLLMVAECPDAETAHAVGLDMESRGNVRATPMRAFDRTEMQRVVKIAEGAADQRDHDASDGQG